MVSTDAPARKIQRDIMADLATMQGRVAWTREHILRMPRDELASALRALPDGVQVQGYSIARYEEGKRTIPVEYLAALSELSGVSLDYLIAGRTPRGTAIDAIRRMRHALDQIEAHYLSDPQEIPMEMYERLDTDGDEDQSGGST